MELNRKHIELLQELLKDEQECLDAVMVEASFQEDYDEMEERLMLLQELQRQAATLNPTY